ncbi:MAG: hypothetical protein ACYC5G_04090 [Candidatus Doudnabacteria bacterium]
MKKLKNIFINDCSKTDQHVFVIDNQKYYKFNGNYAMYELGMINEKREYALRFGDSVEIHQVHGLFTGNCPECGAEMVNVPVIKTQRFMKCFCPECEANTQPLDGSIVPLLNVLDIHSNRPDIFEYEEIALPEEMEVAND